MTALEKIKEITAFLKKCGIEDAHRESEIILTRSLKIDKVALYRDNPVISEVAAKKIDEIVKRRAKREPLQYILGYVDFYGLRIKVGKGVLIPRPETELMVEEVIKTVSSFKFQVSSENKNLPLATCSLPLKILDLCTGSGCLAIAIAKHLPNATVYGTDISEDAIRYAKENAEIYGVKNVTFLRGSLFEPIKRLFTVHCSLFTVIVSNPPYIKSEDIPNLQPEIREWESLNALDGGEDGLRYYREILSKARQYLVDGGYIFLELGERQADHVSQIAEMNGFKNISFIKDYAGIDRIISISC